MSINNKIKPVRLCNLFVYTYMMSFKLKENYQNNAFRKMEGSDQKDQKDWGFQITGLAY